MTLVLGLVLTDGIVIAADSRTTANIQNRARIGSDHTSKLFEIEGFSVATAGWNYFAGHNVAWHMEQFSATVAAGVTLANLATALHGWFAALYQQAIAKTPASAVPAGTPAIQFLVAGFQGAIPAVYQVHVPATAAPVVPGIPLPANFGTVWQAIPNANSTFGLATLGSNSVVYRLINGYDLNSVPPAQWQLLGPSAPIVPWDFFTFQDGIDLVNLLFETTMRMQHFAWGTVGVPQADNNSVGGPVDIAVVNATSHLWLKKKELHSEPIYVEQL